MPAVAGIGADLDRPVDVTVFAVARGDNEATVAHLLEQIPLALPIAVDDASAVGDLYDQTRVGLPFGEQYLVGRDGRIDAIFAGYDPEGVQAAFDAAP